MNRLLEMPATTIEIDGVNYTINTDWKPAVNVWAGYQAYTAGELSIEGYAALLTERLFLEPKPDIFNERAIKFASDYINAFSDGGGSKSKIPPIDLEQDSGMIFRALLAMGINLRTDKLTYEEFLAYIRELPENCEYSRIMHLRLQWYENRQNMTKEERKACARIGWDKVKIKDRCKERERQDNKEYFRELRNKKRAELGLPLL